MSHPIELNVIRRGTDERHQRVVASRDPHRLAGDQQPGRWGFVGALHDLLQAIQAHDDVVRWVGAGDELKRVNGLPTVQPLGQNQEAFGRLGFRRLSERDVNG